MGPAPSVTCMRTMLASCANRAGGEGKRTTSVVCFAVSSQPTYGEPRDRGKPARYRRRQESVGLPFLERFPQAREGFLS